MRRIALALALLAGCTERPPTSQAPEASSVLEGHGSTRVDTTPKEDPRLLPAETYVRSYLALFGGLAPLDAQRALQQTGTGLFDAWTDYLGALGFPDYRIDIPRGGQSNTLMVASFERLGVALCDAALVRDQKQIDLTKRAVFDFALPADAAPSTLTQDQFAPLFDHLHRLFLSYPAALAPTGRTARFYALYQKTVNGHAASSFKPNEAGWAAVCYGLVRHPEFHLY